MSSLRSRLVRAARLTARACGLDFYRVSQFTDPMIRLVMLLTRLRTQVVIDVGANEGQFASDLRAAGYRGHIVSIEPLAAAHAALSRSAANDAKWTVGERCAVGAVAGRATLHVAGNSVSSSLREMTDAHLAAAAESRYVAEEEVSVVTLADLIRRHAAESASSVFVKLDVQGHERDVLEGAGDQLHALGGVQLELSLVELYAGQALMPTQVEFLASHGLALWSIDRGFMDGETGRLLQCDGTFVRESAIERR
jgi:FkbM family methyltransferase